VWVLFHGQQVPLQMLEVLLKAVGTVVLVDNRPDTSIPLSGLDKALNDTGYGRFQVIVNGNQEGLAGAYNRAVAWLRGQPSIIDCVVFLDEDSDASTLGPFLSDREVRERLASPSTASVAPVPLDLATGLRSKPMQFLSRWRLRYLPRDFGGLQPVAFVINSMSVWRMSALCLLGPYDEGLAVDHVDTEYCLRAHRRGLQVYCHGAYTFAHRIGQRRRFSLLGVQMQAGGHSPARRYLIGRNTVWLARRSLRLEPGFTLLCALRLAYEAAGILLAEEQRGAKLRALLRGAASGLWAR
jgi:rhamnosyltransferase